MRRIPDVAGFDALTAGASVRPGDTIAARPSWQRFTTSRSVAYWRTSSSSGSVRTPMVLLHGLGADHDGLRDVVVALGDRDIVVPDLPGYGVSPPLAGPHTMMAYAAVVEDLRTHLGVSSIVLAGHSLGANIALAYAATHPERVAALALLHPVCTGDGPVARLGRAYYRVATWLPERFARWWVLSRPAIFLADSMAMTTRDPSRRRAILAQDYRAATLASPRAIGEAYQSLVNTAYLDLATRVVAPTLLVTGDRDGFARPASVRDLAARVPASRLVVIAGAGHLWPVEDPSAAASLLRSLRQSA
jgi:pimeloyl-ACP methyl ester carboxylesterase